ncbi:hypothetical protein RGQ29_024276 [Quercus rubra]|uniref:HTH three-helical bundle domain-containing protein n=1 Tax=Quercus rubra TaxID=3512 RepID=A0AAN7IKB2_QUERU|nr:hypothetical protein RGQ29_024276 [Quercus rubra]
MEKFPCPLELKVASALLLLSVSGATPPSLISPPPKFDREDVSLKDGRKRKSCRESLVLKDSNKDLSLQLQDDDYRERSVSVSCSSSLTSEVSSEEIRACRMRLISAMARHHQMNLKVVRKSRSKIQYSSDGRKISSDKSSTVTSESVSREASCLSSNSSAGSKSSHYGGTTTSKRQGPGPEEMMKKRKRVGSNHIRRRADAILKFLSAGCFSEVKIRQALGDSPDTSKALRMLVMLEEVKRSGTGGRQDPYIYTHFCLCNVSLIDSMRKVGVIKARSEFGPSLL